jgi:alpha-L-arabinofuranosidase
MIALCNKLDVKPIITTTATSSPEELADLVEYCLGNETTPMGRQRAADGHPEQYKVQYFELGNEQNNGNFVPQVATMEAKAREIGRGSALFYIFPSNSFLNGTELAAAKALRPRIDSQILVDLHVGALHPGSAMQQAASLFELHPHFNFGAINLETNAATHMFACGMSEASDLNHWFNAATSRLHGRFASFCLGSSQNVNDQWDQAIAFSLPNMTW